MKAAIMQPYFLPYIGYYQLIAAADVFIIYDDIKYTKKGWINRNRMLLGGRAETFSLPLKAAADSRDVCERELDPGFDRGRLLRRFEGAYRHAPHAQTTLNLLARIVQAPQMNLFSFLRRSLEETLAHLGVKTRLTVSSEIAPTRGLKGAQRVLALCRAVGASEYLNPIGGTELYAKDAFASQGIALNFLRARPFEYRQFDSPFVPWLSIVDALMFNSLDEVRERVLSGYDLV